MVWAGARAFVFCATTTTGQTIAVRFPRNPRDEAGIRYDALSRHLSSCSQVPLVNTTWAADAATRPSGGLHPVITMDWVEGKQLDRYVDEVVADPNCQPTLDRLAATWLRCNRDLITAELGHGDIHAGNILVDHGGGDPNVTLVDYDCVWVPGLHVGSDEAGLAAFQHPGGAKWGPFMDAFPSTVVYLSLRALAAEPDLWFRDDERADDNLLFKQRDFARPGDSEVFKDLTRSPDPVVQELTDLVLSWIQEDPDTYGPLHKVIEEVRTDPEPERQRWRPPEQPDGGESKKPGEQIWKPRSSPPPPRSTDSGTQVWNKGEGVSDNQPPSPAKDPSTSSLPSGDSPLANVLGSTLTWVRAHPWWTAIIVLIVIAILAP